ncbi:NAD-dependent epimerase/dehydratase family protein [Ruegeria lacuscaerulensis]|uniref:NAD-dependent epimerase/dehydratase family protein n=1 Tax=Ruegeria lacuscaerulensis TaxID=55218 RepID=UPI00147A4E9C|nr:NAD-dependent epimerase/dehydratase family protein [Ruegeria lacuscaerulensis]
MSDEPTARALGRVLLTGATGMVGSSVLAALLEEESVTEVVSLGRRSSGRTHAKLTDISFTDFGNSASYTQYLIGIDTVFHCLATYSARVSRETYSEVTVNWLINLVRACEETVPEATFCLFSAQGARTDGGGMSFALKVKGEAETVLFASHIKRKFAFRPGYIAPSERSRWKPLDYLFAPLHTLVPSIGVASDELAQAMIRTVINNESSSAVLENTEMRALLL